MIEELNSTVKCKIASSPIHGVGVFAIRDIKKGEKLHCVEGNKVWLAGSLEGLYPEVKELILQRFPIAQDGLPFLSPNDDARLLSFMNHSDEPNYDKHTDEAFEDIKKGTEITEDYGEYKNSMV